MDSFFSSVIKMRQASIARNIDNGKSVSPSRASLSLHNTFVHDTVVCSDRGRLNMSGEADSGIGFGKVQASKKIERRMVHIAITNQKHQLCYKFLVSRVKSIDLVPERNGELRPRVKLTDSLDQSIQPLLL